MQLATKSAILVGILFLVGLGSVSIWVERDFQETSRVTMTNTAELIAKQIRATLTEPILDSVLQREPGSYSALREIVDTSIDESATIQELTVVDADGIMIAGGVEGNSYPDAASLFGGQTSLQIVSEYRSRFTVGNHIALVPVTSKGEILAYLNIGLSNSQINDVYDRLVSRFANFALAGIAAIVLLGGLLHLELSRIGREIVRLMNPAAKSNTSSSPQRFGPDEFALVRDSAVKFGAHNLQRKSALDKLTKALEIGLVFLPKPDEIGFASASARSMLGCDESEDDLLNGVDVVGWQKVEASADQLVRSSKNTLISTIAFTCGEELRQMEFELFQMSDDSDAVIAVIRNEEQVKALQSSLRAATRMHTLSSIYMGAAHDLRGPISAMVLNLELLEDSIEANIDQLPASDSEDQKRFVIILRDELMRLQRFLSSFLDNATTASNRGPELIEVTSIIEELFGLFGVKARLAEIELVSELGDEPVWIRGAQDQIRQLFMNIILNAIEAMTSGGTLTCSVTTNDGKALIKFLDTGPGIPTSVADQVFDLHFSTKETGTGIGLYVSKTIVEHHGGEIRFDSTLGDGASISISLPAHSTPGSS